MKTLYEQDSICTGSNNSRYHLADYFFISQINFNEENITIFCTMSSYKLKVMNVEDDTLHLLPIKQNGNAYPRVENNC